MRFPAEARPDIVGRLRSPDYAQHASAYWELHLHETFTQSGFEVKVHPAIAGGARQPDFLVSRGDESFYLEAKCLISKAQDSGASARTKRVYDALDSIDCPNFFLQIDVNRVGPADLRTKALRRKLEAWVTHSTPTRSSSTTDTSTSVSGSAGQTRVGRWNSGHCRSGLTLADALTIARLASSVRWRRRGSTMM